VLKHTAEIMIKPTNVVKSLACNCLENS